MKVFRVVGHAVVLTLISTLAIFINASSPERPLGRQDSSLLPQIRDHRPYLLKGLDLSPEGIGARLLPIRLQDQDLSGMDLREARFPARGLRTIRLRGAHLARADFSCVALEQVDFSGADLSETLFDFSTCRQQQRTSLCPTIGRQRLAPCSILHVDLRGTDLSGALLQGKLAAKQAHGTANQPPASPGPAPFCDHWLVIKGHLDGARLTQATLRCVVLSNQDAPQSVPASKPVERASDQRNPPDYAGLSFVKSTLENVILDRGNFVFSDFWQAQIIRMIVNLPEVDLRYTSMADLRCPREDCELLVSDLPSAQVNPRLSLNVRGSRIRSNLVFSSSPTSWPALMCNSGTSWMPLQGGSAPGAQPNVSCDPSSGLLVLKPVGMAMTSTFAAGASTAR